MAFGAKGLTNKGRNLQAKAQAGAELKYTKFVFGDGMLGNQSIALLTNVISPKKTELVTRVFVVPADQRANIGMYFTNSDVTTGFIWREIGLYALDPDEGEILYWYGYDQNGTEIPAGGGSEILEQTFDTLVYVGTAQNISSTVDQSLVFTTTEQLQEALDDAKNYTDQAIQNVNVPDASLTQKGKVQLTNETTSTSQTLAATGKAVNDARQAAITAAGLDATNKATTAENNAKGASLPRTGGSLTGRLDFQTWGSISADTGGSALYGSNCYLDPNGSPRTFRYTNTHANLGARGIFMQYTGGATGAIEIYEFDTGAVASTAGAAFTPTLKRILNADEVVLPNDNPTTNLLINSTGLFGLDGWTNVSSYPILSSTSPDVSGLFYTNDAVPSGQYAILKSNVISVAPGAQYDIQSLFFSSGSPVGTVIQIELKNAANDATFYTLVADPQKWWHRKKGTVTIPAGISQVSVWLVVANAPAGQTKGFARIRFNLRNIQTKDVPYDFTGDMAYVASQLQAVKTSGVDAKQGIVNAINAKGGSASMSDTWAQLAAKIQAIQTGPKYASGVATSTASTDRLLFNLERGGTRSTTYFTVSGLGFRPNRIIVKIPNYDAQPILYSTTSRNGAGGYNLYGSFTNTQAVLDQYRVYEMTGQNVIQNAYVNDTSILLPAMDMPLAQIQWEAFQV